MTIATTEVRALAGAMGTLFSMPDDWARTARVGSWEEEVVGGAIDRRTLSAWTRRYLGLRARQYDAYAGWEWVLEAALRQESGGLTGTGG